jgi:hypothetical protein
MAAFLGVAASPEQCREIAEALRPDAVRAVIAAAEQDALQSERLPRSAFEYNLDGSIRIIDRETGFQTGHVSGLSDGQWRAVLDAAEIERLNALTGDWLRRHAFEAEPPECSADASRP